MKKIFAPLISIATFVFVVFLLSKIITPVAELLAWFFITKEEVSSTLTTGQAILIDILTHLITYASVGGIFAYLNAWNSQNMHYAYIIISEIISLCLAVLLRFILDYYWILLILLGIILTTGVIMFFLARRKNKTEELNGKA